MKIIPKHYRSLLFFGIGFFFLIGVAFAAQNFYQLNLNDNPSLTFHGICKNVKNNSVSNIYFIPGNTSEEWSAFLTKHPNDVDTSDCCTPTCTTGPGCLTSLVNGFVTSGTCCNGGSCYTCNPNYTWNGSSCVANTQTANCTAKPANTTWNTVSSITQTWNGTAWTPSTSSVYNPTASSTECRYKCNTGYTWGGSSCVANTQTANCTAKPVNTIWNTVSSITQTWNGTAWTPSNSSVHNITASSTECRFKCNVGFNWNGSACTSVPQNIGCTSKPANTTWNTVSSITQTWNGTEWTPSNTSVYNPTASSTECRYKCNVGYHWNGSSCIENTWTINCSWKPANTTWNTVSSITQTWNGTAWTPSNTSVYNPTASSTECRFKCNVGHTWNGSSCVVVPVPLVNNSTNCSINIANTVTIGSTYPVTITITNNGTKTWLAGQHKLGSQDPQDNAKWGFNRIVLASNVSPGNTAIFNRSLTIPNMTPGSQSFNWKMVEEGVEWFGTNCTKNLTVSCPSGQSWNGSSCVVLSNNSKRLQVNVPSVVVPGNPFSGSVSFNNNGTSYWYVATHKLGSRNPENNLTWGTNRLSLPYWVPPTNDILITFSLNAPTTPGTYSFSWRMVEENVQWFGDEVNVPITVCAHECTENAKRCSGGGVQTCVTNADSDPCREWSAPTACEQCKTCSGGACVNVANNTTCSEGGNTGTCQNGVCKVCRWTPYSVYDSSQCRNTYPTPYIDGTSCTCGDTSTRLAWFCQTGPVGGCSTGYSYYCRRWYHQCR